MMIVTIASVAVMLLALVAGALWLAAPLRDRDEDEDRAEDRDRRGAHYDDDLLDSMRRHPSAYGTSPDIAPPATGMSPAAHTVPGNAHPPELHARARVVFASVENGRLVLDCVLAEADGPGIHTQPGLPITLSLGALETPWLAVHVEAMLERWADGERVVDLELLDSPIGPRATLVSASSRLVLPLATVAGLD